MLNYPICASKVLEEEGASTLNGGPAIARGAPVEAAVVILLKHDVCWNVLLAPASTLGPVLPGRRNVLSGGHVLINLGVIINLDGELCKVGVRESQFSARHGVRRGSSSRVRRSAQVVCFSARHRVS
eukprot:5824129-Amphidinium_carterae.3